MSNQLNNNNELYACASIVDGACMEWVVIDNPAPILPNFTVDEWNSLGVLVVLCIVFAWGFKVLGGLIK